MNLHTSIANYLHPATGTIQKSEPLRQIQKYAQAGNFQSIIVVNGNAPVGIIRRETIVDNNDIPTTSLAKDIMFPDSPVLTPDTLVHEARTTLEITGLDRLPVVNGLGELIGVFARDTLKEATSMKNDNTPGPAHDQPTVRQTLRAFTVHPGMTVISSDGEKIGLVDRLYLDQGIVSGFLVSHGSTGDRHKQLKFDLVDHLDDETIILTLDAASFLEISDTDPNED